MIKEETEKAFGFDENTSKKRFEQNHVAETHSLQTRLDRLGPNPNVGMTDRAQILILQRQLSEAAKNPAISLDRIGDIESELDRIEALYTKPKS